MGMSGLGRVLSSSPYSDRHIIYARKSSHHYKEAAMVSKDSERASQSELAVCPPVVHLFRMWSERLGFEGASGGHIASA